MIRRSAIVDALFKKREQDINDVLHTIIDFLCTRFCAISSSVPDGSVKWQRKYHKYMCIATNQPYGKSNRNVNPDNNATAEHF